MGKDFRIGLMAGVVLAGAAVIWVATRPSLGPRVAQTQNLASVQSPAVVAQPIDNASRQGRPDTVEAVPLTNAPASPVLGEIAEVQNPAAGGTPLVDHGASRSRDERPAMSDGQTDLTIYELSEPIKTTKFHIVRRGENLSAISQQHYGSSSRWRKILAANQKVIKDPNKIAPGTKLIIPD